MANFSALKTAIQNAIKQNGNEEITGDVLQQILLSVVNTMGDGAINTIEQNLSSETLARQNGDNTLQSNINAEALARGNADNTLQSNIDAEVLARGNADTQLQNAINGEETARGNADTVLQRNIEIERNARIAADNTLDGKIATEKNQRIAAVDSLNAAITAINDSVKNGYVYAGIAQPSSAPMTGKVFYIATKAGQYVNFSNIQVPAGINIIKKVGSTWVSEFVFNSDALMAEIVSFEEQVRTLLEDYQPIIINGDVVNAPDEVDITAQPDGLLKFKDKVYEPLVFSGMGRKYLRKNIRPEVDSVDFDGFVEDVPTEDSLTGTPDSIWWDRINEVFVGKKDDVYYIAWTDDDSFVPASTELIYMYDGNPYRWNGTEFYVDEDVVPTLKNILTQAMISQPNTIYVIQYDFDLGGETVTIPEGCLLEFDGGSLRNGTISWNNTLVEGKVNLQNITVGTGKLSNDTVYVDWFNPYGDGEHDDSNTLIQAVKSIKQVGVTFVFGDNKTYLHGDGLDEVNGTGRQYNSLEIYNTSTWQPSGRYSPDLGWFNVYNNHFGTSETPSPVDLGRDIRLMFEDMSNITIEGNGSSIVSNENNGITRNNSILWLYKCSNIVVKNLKIDGKKNERFNKLGVLYSDYNSGRGYVEWHNIRVVGCSNITFDNVTSDNSCHNAFDIKYNYSDGAENYNITLTNCCVDNAYKNGIGCNNCDGIVIQGGKYGNCGATYGTAPRANIDLEPEATKFIKNILITNATFYWDLDKDLDVDGEVAINIGTKNTEITGCDFINAGLTIVGVQDGNKSATAISVKGCSFLNSIIWNKGKASTIESCSIVYNSEFIVYNGENVIHTQTTPINTGSDTQFISNIVKWSGDLSAFTGYMSLAGVVNNNKFTDLCGSGNYIFRTFANQLNNNTFTDAGVDGKNGKLYGEDTPIAAGQNNIGKGILQYSTPIGIITGPDYIGTAKAYFTRSLLLSSTDVAIQFPYLANNEVATIKVGMREKINNVNTNTFIIYNSKNKNTDLGYETLTNGISNLVLKQGTAGVILDFSNVTFVSSRYVWISVEKDYIYPSFSNYNIYNVLDSAQLNELIQAGSYSPIYNCKTVGDTASRPSSRILIGFQFFDTTLGKPIYWNGTAWVDATGTPV